jgi:superfamily II DNA or RNA helicase
MAAPVTEPWSGAPREPRRWQREAHPVIMAALRARVAGLVYACTGSGKSVLLSEVVHTVLQTMRPGYVVVVLVPTRRLVEQIYGDLCERLGRAEVGRYYGNRKVRRPRRVHVVCLNSTEKYAEWAESHGLKTGLLVCDEAHRADSYADRAALLAPVTRVGFTATPYLSDRGLAGWDRVLYEYRIPTAMAEGVLCPAQYRAGWGDGSMDTVDAAIEVCRDAGRWILVDAGMTIDACEAMASDLRAAGIDAESVHSDVPDAEIDRRLARFVAGDLPVICQVNMLSEGINLPPVRHVVLARRRASRVEMVQLIGRGLRVCGGKTHLTVWDFLRQLPDRDALDRDAILGRLETDADREARTMTRAEVLEAEMEEAVPLARARVEVDDWMLGVASGLRASGVLPPLPDAPPDADGDPSMWRDRPAPPGMVADIRRLGRHTRWMDADLRESLRPLLSHPDDLTIGAASDVLDVLRAAGRMAGEVYQRTGSWHAARHQFGLPDDTPPPTQAIGRIARKLKE